MVLQHSSVGKSLLWHIGYVLLNAKVGIFPLSYAVIPSFISCFTTSCYIDPHFIFKFTTFKNTSLFSFCCSTASYSVTCDFSIRISYMTVVLEYISSQPRGA